MSTKTKHFLISSTALSILALISFGVYYYINLQKRTSAASKIYQITLDNKYATAEDLVGCNEDKTTKICQESLLGYLREGILLRLGSIDKQADTIVTDPLDKANESLQNYSLSKVQEYIEKALSGSNALTQQYISDHSAAAKRIQTTLKNQAVSNLYVNDSWAVVTIISPSTDAANVLMKLEYEGWKILAGPGTGFDQGIATSYGAPAIVDQHLLVVYPKTLVEFPGITTKLSSISTTTNSVSGIGKESLPNYDKLPLNTNEFSVYADYVNNKPYYIVTVYYFSESDKSKNKSAADNWFSGYKIDLAKQPILYDYLQNSTDE